MGLRPKFDPYTGICTEILAVLLSGAKIGIRRSELVNVSIVLLLH